MGNFQGNTTQLQSLLNQAESGNHKAYTELVAQASERMLKLTRKMLGEFSRLKRWEETDDAFQTAALKWYQSLFEVRPESVRQFFGLAATLIRRTLIDMARHHFSPEGHSLSQDDPSRNSVVAPRAKPIPALRVEREDLPADCYQYLAEFLAAVQ